MIMKTMKYFMMGALLFGCSVGTMAQDGSSADVDALKSLIKSKPADYSKQVKNFINKNKKNVDNLMAFGRAFFEAEDSVNAKECANKALSLKKNEYAPAYILLGDLASMSNNGGEAAKNYEMAIYADPKNPEAYRKYAIVYSRVSPEGAVAKLEELRNELPNYPVDRLIGHISYSQQRYASAIEAYSKVAVSDLTRMDFIEYARALQLARKFDESQRIVQAGLSKEPLNATLNRFALMNCNDLKKFDESLKYAEVLFTKVDKDSVNLSDLDYMNYAKAFYGNNQFEEAIAKYKEALAQPAEDKSMHADLYKGISDSYKGMKDYPSAIENYQSFLSAKADADATDHAGLGLLQNSYARSLEGDARVEAFDKADQMWADMIAKFPDAEEYALLQRGNLKAQMDTELKGTAKAFYERLIELIKAHETIDDTDKGRLFNAYSYLMRYNVKQKNSAAALSNAESLLELQPEDAEIKKVVETLRKAAK